MSHFEQSFVWDTNMVAYKAIRCEACKAHQETEKCESCCDTGIDAIPVSEVMSVRVR